MTMNEVRSIWGDADEISTFIPIEENPEDRTIDWKYINSVELSFDSEDNFLLTSITCESKSTTINNFCVMGLSPKELKLKFPEIELDDEYALAINEYRHPRLELSFWANNEKINAVTIYPEYDELGQNCIWPAKNAT